MRTLLLGSHTAYVKRRGTSRRSEAKVPSQPLSLGTERNEMKQSSKNAVSNR